MSASQSMRRSSLGGKPVSFLTLRERWKGLANPLWVAIEVEPKTRTGKSDTISAK